AVGRARAGGNAQPALVRRSSPRWQLPRRAPGCIRRRRAHVGRARGETTRTLAERRFPRWHPPDRQPPTREGCAMSRTLTVFALGAMLAFSSGARAAFVPLPANGLQVNDDVANS